MRYTFPKSEKLKQKTAIDTLFKGPSENLKAYPLLFLYNSNPDHNLVKVGVSVSRRKFKKAVTRNKLKRRMREAYRLSKPKIGFLHGIDIMIIYIANEVFDYNRIQEAMSQGVSSIIHKINPVKD